MDIHWTPQRLHKALEKRSLDQLALNPFEIHPSVVPCVPSWWSVSWSERNRRAGSSLCLEPNHLNLVRKSSKCKAVVPAPDSIGFSEFTATLANAITQVCDLAHRVLETCCCSQFLCWWSTICRLLCQHTPTNQQPWRSGAMGTRGNS